MGPGARMNIRKRRNTLKLVIIKLLVGSKDNELLAWRAATFTGLL
jgi:hypothetical protein